MARIPDTVVDEVLARAPIVDVVGEVVRLKPKGGRYWGLCPFHNEKSPSFTVNAERGFFYCFGCQAKGSTASFLMQYEGLSFPEAVRKLADRVGVTIPAEGVNEEVAQRQRKERDSYFRAMEYAQVVYERALWSGKFPEPLAYLEQRGVDEATARAFGLGFAPPAWGTLAEWGGRAGIRMETMQKAGLVLPRKSGDGAYDRFRNRVMFPVVSLSRKTLAFSGRTLDAEERAKYVNSPETTYYTKGKHLFGLNVAQRAIRQRGFAVLVEGNFDVVSLHARGISMACAALGTALTPEQARLLKRFTERVVLLFDADSAGQAAARKALSVLLSEGVQDVHFCELPDGTDPDDFVQAHGADALLERIESARPMLEMLIDEAVRPAVGGSAMDKRRAVDQVAELLTDLGDDLVRATLVEDVARRLELSVAQVGAGASSARRPRQREQRADAPAPAPAREVVQLSAHEELLVLTLAEEPGLLDEVYDEQLHRLVSTPALSEFLEEVARVWRHESGGGLTVAFERLPEEDPLRAALALALVRDQALQASMVRAAFRDTTLALKKQWGHLQLSQLREDLSRAASLGDEALELELLERHTELMRWMKELQGGASV